MGWAFPEVISLGFDHRELEDSLLQYSLVVCTVKKTSICSAERWNYHMIESFYSWAYTPNS